MLGTQWLLGPFAVALLAVHGCGEDQFELFESGVGGNAGNAGAAAGSAGTAGTGAGGSTVHTGGSSNDDSGAAGSVQDAAVEGSGGSLVLDAAAPCPGVEPTQDSPCEVLGTVCCYSPAPARPWRCVSTNPDGGGASVWKTLNSRVCCPPSPPRVGDECAAPGDLACCYGGTEGVFCNQEPEPDAWAAMRCI